MRKTSLLTTNMDRCFLCYGRAGHIHHIFFGSNRKWSEKYHLIVPLCPSCHNMSNNGVHFNREKDLYLKRLAQEAFEKQYSHEEFMRIFGKNYL